MPDGETETKPRSDADTKSDPKPPEQKPSEPKQPEQKDDKGKQQDDKQQSSGKPKPRWPFFVAGLVVLGFIAVVLYQVFVPKADVRTDDAYVMVHYATISARVSGQVATVEVSDNQVVKAGQVLVTLDPRDYGESLAMAHAALDRDTAQTRNAGANVARQPALLHLKDMAVHYPREQRMAEVGEGNLNWPAILDACRDAGVKWYVVEQDTCYRDPFESLAISFDNLMKME